MLSIHPVLPSGQAQPTNFLCQSRPSVLQCYYPNVSFILNGPTWTTEKCNKILFLPEIVRKLQQNSGKYRFVWDAVN